MSSSARQHTVRLSDPAEFVAAIPHLIGFYPSESVVVTTLHDTEETTRVGMTARIDLPSTRRSSEVATALVRGPVVRDAPTAAVVTVVGGASPQEHIPPVPTSPEGGDGRGLPRRELVEAFGAALEEEGIRLVQALWTPEVRAGGVWYRYTDGRGGTVPDPGSSPVAALLAVSGAVTFPNREELAASIAPESQETLARWSARLNLLQDEADPHRGLADMCVADVEAVFAAIRRTEHGEPLTEEDLLRVLVALSDYRVRDLAMGTALTSRARAAEQLWFTLVRKAPEPEVADVAVLLAFSAYLRGDGALANVALERAERTRPAHRLGELLRRALDAGVGPDTLSEIVRDTAADARMMIDHEEC
ncbi:DUF4192 domain-containing protein [Actinopolyspora mortivallis]|uniref:DUF4192 domain-containing protein n=1 Tax=Actinopolyspora mortivallis TaxID=33906 RepID=UPI00036CC244|nr:DUF4192 domain-containing protein [Actinopolyspora mortivallis]